MDNLTRIEQVAFYKLRVFAALIPQNNNTFWLQKPSVRQMLLCLMHVITGRQECSYTAKCWELQQKAGKY